MHRDLRQDLLAITVGACVALLAVTLLSFDPQDPITTASNPLVAVGYEPQVLAFPQHERPRNACGPAGAAVAEWMFSSLGWGAYYVLCSLMVCDIQLWRHRRPDAPIVRTLGWYLSLVAFCTIGHLLAPRVGTVGTYGGGGYIGHLGASLLATRFYAIGSWIICLSSFVAGLLLASDYVLFHLAWLLLGATWAKSPAALGWAKRLGLPIRFGTRRTPLLPVATDMEEVVATPTTTDGLPIRIRGKRLTDLDARTATEDESEEEEEAELEEELEEEYEDDDAEMDESSTAETDLLSDVEGDQAPEKAAAALAGPLPVKRVNKKATKAKAPDEERQEVIEQLEEASWQEEPVDNYELPDIGLLLESEEISYDRQAKEVRRKAKILEKTFSDFGFNVKVVEIETGPVIAQYEVELEAGLRLSKITGLADDLAIALRAPSVRIVAPIPGKNTVGIEVPNEERQLVRLREVMEESNARIKKMYIPLFLGKDVSGNALTVDLASLPHLLIAGRTGTGKSVCLNSIISSILMTRRPDEVRMLMIDPKMVELSGYRTLPHLMHPVVTDMRKAEAILAWAVDKMEERYELLARAGVRHIASYNQLGREELMDRLSEDEEGIRQVPLHLPFIVIVADEIADMMMTAGKEVEQHIIRLAQKSRAVGIHLILATQKPTVDVITGLIKSNLPARICFQVASRTDSRVVLDEMGADKLLGNGDMLFLWPGTSTLLRGQGTYMSDDEINRIVDAVSTGEQDFVHELVQMKVEAPDGEAGPASFKQRDELYEQAIDVVVRERRGSVSLLQRALGIGYGRAARLIDFMAEDGIVGPYNGSQAREIVMTVEQWEQMQQGETPAASSPNPANSDVKRNKILPLSKSEKAVSPPATAVTKKVTPDTNANDESDNDESEGEEEYDAAEYEEYDDEESEEDEYEEDEYEDYEDEDDDTGEDESVEEGIVEDDKEPDKATTNEKKRGTYRADSA